jgi:hypothetical protein
LFFSRFYINSSLGVFPIGKHLIFLAASHLTPLKLPRILDTEPLGCLLSNLIEMTLKLLLI